MNRLMRLRARARSDWSAIGFTQVIQAARRTTGERTCDGPPMTRRSYRLTIEGELGEIADEVFVGTSVRTERGNTVVVARDQAELLGLMQRISDLGLTLISASPTDERVRAGAPRPVRNHPGEPRKGFEPS
jgi:hypothetical protein